MSQETLTQPHATPLVGADAPWTRVTFAPPEAWVEDESYETVTPAGAGLPVTHLCMARQVDAASGRIFHLTAVRLETIQAAQNEAQWSIELDARAQRVTLHWLRVVRGGVRFDQLRRERMRLVQRDTQLERLMLDGRWTLLAVLDDVRPGDIVEAAYTYEIHDLIRPGGCEVLFAVPPQMVVGRYHFSVRTEKGADLRWSASSDAPERREEALPDGRRRWSWTGSQTGPREPEPNTPATWMDQVWVQVSDLSDWSVLAARMTKAWEAAADGSGLAEFEFFARPERVDAEAIMRLVTHLQEEFRHFSLDLAAGGWVPSAPAEVARRRFGDGKDLVWLAATVLRGWGVRARPVLVGGRHRAKVSEWLPMAILLNHAVLEVEWEGRERWFDLAESGQGGGFVERAVTWFGHGLPVGGAAPGLRVQPGEQARGVFALRETVLLDTTRGGVSLIEQRARAEGWQADVLRRAMRAQGAEAFAKEREQFAQRRHARARRLGEMRWRDDQAANVFETVEVFELTEAAHPEERGSRAIHELPPSPMATWFALPGEKPRRTPWSLAFPCEVQHSLIIKAAGMMAGTGRRRRWAEPEFEATLDDTRINAVWTRVCRFTVLAPEVSVERVAAYRKELDSFLHDVGGRVYPPWGRGRLHRGKGFGEFEGAGTDKPEASRLPEAAPPSPSPGSAAASSSEPAVPAADVSSATSATAAAAATEHKLAPGGGRRRREKHVRRESSRVRRSPVPVWMFVAGAIIVLIVMFGVLRSCVSGP